MVKIVENVRYKSIIRMVVENTSTILLLPALRELLQIVQEAENIDSKTLFTHVEICGLKFNVRMPFFHAFRTNTVAELSFGMFDDKFFKAVPVSLVVANFLTVHADGDNAA